MILKVKNKMCVYETKSEDFEECEACKLNLEEESGDAKQDESEEDDDD